MKPAGCPDETTLGEILTLPPGDPGRRHAESCPRCRALVLSHAAFETPEADLEAEWAEGQVASRLEAFREELLGLTATASPPANVGAWRSGGASRSWWRSLLAPPLRPAWSVAVAGAIVAAVVVGVRENRPPAGTIVRGGGTSALELATPGLLPGGAVRLSWRPASEPVERYELVFFTAQLEPLARVPAGRDTVVILPASALPAAFRSGAPLLYRVEALSGNDTVARSETGSLQGPGR